jgi:hypothetical protein
MEGKRLSKDIHADNAIPPNDEILTAGKLRKRFPLVASEPTYCRWAREGVGPRFVNVNGRRLYPLSWFLAWLSGQAVSSTAEIPASTHGARYAHLEAARAKALEVKATKRAGGAA